MRRRSAALILCLACVSGPATSAGLEQVGRVVWDGEVVQGISGIEVSEDGARFEAVSDAGWRFAGQLVRRGETLEAVTLDRLAPILGNDGWPVSARRVGDWRDAEGLAVAPDGTSWISFERWSRVQRFDPGDPTGQWIKDHSAFREQSDNRQLEAVAVDAAGRVFTFPERPMADGFPIFVLEDDGWRIEGHIAERDGFSIVGADFDDAGTLWLLERKHFLGRLWRNRIRRLDPSDPETIETVWTGARDEFYNLEGLSVWRASDGLRILCVGDNNGKRTVPTEIVEFRLVE